MPFDCVSAHSRCTNGVFLRVHSRFFDTAETFSSSTDSDSDGSWEEKSFHSEGFSDDSSSSSSTNSNSSNKGDNGSNEEGKIVHGAKPYHFEPLAANRGGAEADGRDDVLSSEQRVIDRF